MKRDWKQLLYFLFIFGTLAVVLLVGFNGQEMSGAMDALRAIGPGWIVLCLVCYAAYIACDSLSLCYFLRRQGEKITLGYAFFVTAMGAYYSNITPGATGGQPMQAYYLSRKKIPLGMATSALTVKLFCFQFMLAVIGTVLWIVHGPFIHQQVGQHMWILVIGYVYNWFTVLLVVLMAFFRGPVQLVIRLFVKVGVWLRICKDPEASLHKWGDIQEGFHSSILTLCRRPMDLAVQLLLGGLQLLCLMAVICCVYGASNLSGVSNSQLVALGVMLYTSAAYTPLPGASGAQEGVFALYFSQVFPDGIRLMALLLWRFFTYYVSLIAGAVLSVASGFISGRKKA